MEVVRAELAAVVAGADRDHALLAPKRTGRAHASGRSPRDRGLGEAIDHDLQYRLDLVAKARVGLTPERRAIGVVGRGDQALVLRADLGARAHDATREG